MKFEEVLPALRRGKKARRKNWSSAQHIRVSFNSSDYLVNQDGITYSDSIMLDNWEIVEEPRKVTYVGYVLERPDHPNPCHYSIGEALGHMCSPIYTEPVVEPTPREKLSKWKITMEEI